MTTLEKIKRAAVNQYALPRVLEVEESETHDEKMRAIRRRQQAAMNEFWSEYWSGVQ